MTATAVPPKTPSMHAPNANDRLEHIELDQLHDSPLNPREYYDPVGLEELKESLLQGGQITPVIARPRKKGGGYELAAGHRRIRAARLACEKHPEGARARGLTRLLAIVREMDDTAFNDVLNVENLQRRDLLPLEEARGFENLIKHAGYDHKRIAHRTGFSERYVYDSLTLLKLVPDAKTLFQKGFFERSHAVELARLTPEKQRQAIGDTVGLANGRYVAPEKRGFLFERTDLAHERQLPLTDRIKPVTVLEFKQRIQDRVRFTAEHVDPVLFPDTAQFLKATEKEKLKPVYITFDHQVGSWARDPNIRTYPITSWKRADGQEGSKTCAYGRPGIVAAGEHRGDAFRVCVSKDSCERHWGKKKQPAKTGYSEKRESAAGAEAKRQEQAQAKAERERREQERQRARYKKAVPALLAALAEKVKRRPLAKLAQVVIQACAGGYGGSVAAKALPRGRTAEDLIRHAAFLKITRQITGNDWWIIGNATNLLRPYGLNARAIVDKAVPEKKPEPKASQTFAKAKAAKTAKRPKGKKW